MHFKGMLSIGAALVAAVALVSASGAGTSTSRNATQIDVSTRAAVAHYLRSIHVNPKGLVVQRGTRNYAGPQCPGKSWTCTSTAHPVVQVAPAGGKNTFTCSTARCAVVQVAAASAKMNKAICVKTSGLGANCSITQSSSGTTGNMAMVWEDAGKLTGLTQTALYSASVTQKAAGSGANTACAHQAINIDGSTGKNNTTSATVALEAHQSIIISQDSASGGNTVEDASAPVNGVPGCVTLPASCPNSLSDPCGLSQTQTLSSNATSKGTIIQNENKTDSGPNMKLDIKQNQSGGFKGSASGANNAVFTQTNTLTAIATSPVAPTQWQSSQNGGILATVNQDSSDVSTAIARQKETQCEDAQASPALTQCASPGGEGNPYGSTLSQTQYGPVRKSLGDSSQTGNSGDSFTVVQNSQQDNDTGSGQTNVLSGGFHTDGTGTVSQTATVDGQTSTDTQGGSGDVSGSMNCTGSTCTSTPQPSATVLIAGAGDPTGPQSGGPTEPNDNLAQALTSAGYSVTESATLPEDLSSFGQVWWVDSGPPSEAEQDQLINFAQSGKGVYLTGERPCCEALNDADQSIVNAVVVGGNNITIGHQGDVCGCNAPLPVSPNVVGSLATRPHTVTSWTPDAPGGMAGVPDSSVFSYYQPNPSTKQVVAAAWDRASTSGNGRLVVFMDINWPEATNDIHTRGANWTQVAENVAFFLSGLTSPPTPPILLAPAAMVPAEPAPFAAPAQATPRTATGSASSTR